MMDFSLRIRRFSVPHSSYGLLSSFITDLRVEEGGWLAHPVAFFFPAGYLEKWNFRRLVQGTMLYNVL